MIKFAFIAIALLITSRVANMVVTIPGYFNIPVARFQRINRIGKWCAGHFTGKRIHDFPTVIFLESVGRVFCKAHE